MLKDYAWVPLYRANLITIGAGSMEEIERRQRHSSQ